MQRTTQVISTCNHLDFDTLDVAAHWGLVLLCWTLNGLKRRGGGSGHATGEFSLLLEEE